MTEPSGGSDLAALKTTAVRDGDAWVINGSKTFITNGGHADLVIVAAKTDPERGAKGITLFGVEAGMAGFQRGTKLDTVGQPEADTSELFFENVRVPGAHMIGELDSVDASKAKWWTSDVQNQIIDGCVQLFGGYGYMREYRVARAWMDARVTRIWAGSNEIMKEIIGRAAGL